MVYIVRYFDSGEWRVCMDVFEDRERAEHLSETLRNDGYETIVSARRLIKKD